MRILSGGHDGRPAQSLTSRPGGVEAFVSALDDEFADEFGPNHDMSSQA
jgi:hypothetical protein